MPATPSPSRRQRAGTRSTHSLSLPDQVEEGVAAPESPRVVSAVEEMSPIQVTVPGGWAWLRKSAHLFRFGDDTKGLLEQSVAWVADGLGGPTALYLNTSEVPNSLDIRAFHPSEPWMARITQDLLGESTGSGASMLMQQIREGRPLLIPNPGTGVLTSGGNLPESALGAGIVSLLIIPMKAESRDVGALAFMSQQGRQLGEEDMALAMALAGIVATAIDTQRTLGELRRSINIRDMSISTASHELRNGLATTRALAQMSLRAIKNTVEGGVARVENHLETMLRQIDWLTDLTGNVFDVSRIDSGHMELRKGPASLNSVVVGVVERFRGIMAEHTKLRLKVVLPNVQLVGSWDRERIDQVLTNLLANAIKYSPKGGLLTVRVEQKDPDTVNPEEYLQKDTDSNKQQMAIVAISDQGIGIPTNQLASIFEPYYRATNVPKELGGSLGLGLHICKGIVEAHGGGLWVESVEGRGSTFYFSLPLLTTA